MGLEGFVSFIHADVTLNFGFENLRNERFRHIVHCTGRITGKDMLHCIAGGCHKDDWYVFVFLPGPDDTGRL
ncbi:hypothetical protein D3C80_1896310 [compost metagenome]